MRTRACITFVMPNGERIRWFCHAWAATSSDGVTPIMSQEELTRLLTGYRPDAVSVMLIPDEWPRNDGSAANDDDSATD